MGNAFGSDTIPVILTLVDVHNVRTKEMYYFCNVSNGDISTKVIGRSQSLSVEVTNYTILTLLVYECQEYLFTPEISRAVGILRVPISRVGERYSSGFFQQWFNLDCTTDPRHNTCDVDNIIQTFEKAYAESTSNVYTPKVCVSLLASAFEVPITKRRVCSIFVSEQVKEEAGPDARALVASHKQQSEYINSLHEELRRLQGPSYRPLNLNTSGNTLVK
eukprot:GHVR01086064.1.p1 GENE.GHVR01086064.1~~GHVR01086064.1.p1  ORF type:complete len:219 (-),score=35.23 GHVR01086064.1:232-888(-)